MRRYLYLALFLLALSPLCAYRAATVAQEPTAVVAEEPLPAYMIQNNDGRWLGKTLPGYINIWVFDRSAAYCWVNKQKAHQAWTSLGFVRNRAEIKTFKLTPVED